MDLDEELRTAVRDGDEEKLRYWSQYFLDRLPWTDLTTRKLASILVAGIGYSSRALGLNGAKDMRVVRTLIPFWLRIAEGYDQSGLLELAGWDGPPSWRTLAELIESLVSQTYYTKMARSTVNEVIEIGIETYGSREALIAAVMDLGDGLYLRTTIDKVIALRALLRDLLLLSYFVEEGYLEPSRKLSTRLDELFDELSTIDTDAKEKVELAKTISAAVHLIGLLRWNPLRRAWVHAVVTAPK